MYSEFDRELGEQRVEQERQAKVAAATKAVERRGRAFCECGATISELRRERFGAVRCLECQKEFEREQVMK